MPSYKVRVRMSYKSQGYTRTASKKFDVWADDNFGKGHEEAISIAKQRLLDSVSYEVKKS